MNVPNITSKRADEFDSLPVPWTEAYLQRRHETLRATFSNSELLACFGGKLRRLPRSYGRGLDERCVEYPWLLAQLSDGPAVLLDAGSSLNQVMLLEHPLLSAKRVHIVTLAPEQEFFPRPGVSYIYEDLRDLPFRDNFYDVVVSVSTLEHVGCDNTFYTGGAGDGQTLSGNVSDYVLALRELNRVLKPGGLLLITVPYGIYQFHGAFQQFDRAHLTKAEKASEQLSTVEEVFYRYSADGWQISTEAECADCKYVQWVADLMRTCRWPEAPPREVDGATAARAVACVKLRKHSLPAGKSELV